MTARPTRRALFGTPAALLALGTAAGRPTMAAAADGPLLTMVARWNALQHEADAFPHAEDGGNWSEFSDLLGRQNEVGRQIASTPARTCEGLEAKARLLRALHGQKAEGDTDPIPGTRSGCCATCWGRADMQRPFV